MLESNVDLQLLYRAASAYYLEDLRQVEVADRLGVSRPTVSKLLAEARRIGMVGFSVQDPGTEDLERLATQVREALDLEEVYVAPGDQVQRDYQGLGELLGAAVMRHDLSSGDVVLMSSGKTTYAVSDSAALPQLPGVVVVPTVGGQQEIDPWHQSNEVVRRFAARTGASPRYLFAPALPGPALWSSLTSDPSYVAMTELWERAKLAVLGIGGPTAQREDIASMIPRKDPSLQNADGDVALHFFDRYGAALTFPGSDRLVRVPFDLIQKIPVTIAVAAGTHKARGIVAAATVDLFHTLITDVPTARAVLDAIAANRHS